MHLRNDRRWTLLVLLSALLVVPQLAHGQAQSVRVSDNQLLTLEEKEGEALDTLRGRDLVGLAVNPADPEHIVEVEEEFLTGQCSYRVTFDRGRSWAGGDLQAPEGYPSPPCPVFDSNGYAHSAGSVVFGSGDNVYTTFSSIVGGSVGGDSETGDSVLVARSTDGGRTFETAVVAIPGVPAGDGQPVYIRPEIGVEPRADGDRVYVSAWGLALVDRKISAARIVTAASEDGGVTWQAPVDATAPDGKGREQSAPVAGPDGAVYLAWRTLDPAPATNRLVVARSSDGGKVWQQADVAPVTGTRGADPKLAIDGDGTLHVAYTFNSARAAGSENPAESEGTDDDDILAVRSTDGGMTWSAPVRVNDDPAGNDAEQSLAEIAVAPNGRIDLAWHDRRHAYTGPAESNDIYYASSDDQGQSFSANHRVTDRTINLDVGLDRRIGTTAFYTPALAALDDSSAMVAWADPRQGNFLNGSQDIYFATVNRDADAATPVEELASPDGIGDIALSQLAYPGGNQRVDGEAGTQVVVVGEDDVAAALAGAVLARAHYGPVLVSPADGLSDALKEEVRRLGPSGAFLLGDEESLSSSVADDLSAAGVPAEGVTRLGGADEAALAAEVAQALADTPQLSTGDLEDLVEEGGTPPAIEEAVIVNPESPGAAAGAALAAARRLPVLFVASDAVPPQTAEALSSLAVKRTLVIGDASAIEEGVMSDLPSPTRLGGDGAAATSEAVADEAVDRGVATNIVYLADSDRPLQAAVMAAASARLGGLLLVAPGAGVDEAQEVLDRLDPTTSVDRIVAVSSTSTGTNWVPVALGALFVLAGVAFLLFALRRARARRSPAAAGG